MKELTVAETDIAGVDALALTGELNFDTSPKLRKVLVEKCKNRQAEIVVDLTDLGFMDTCGLATLIEARQRADGYGGRVVLVGVSPLIEEVMDITRVKDLFTIIEDREKAESTLGQAG